MKLVFDNGKEIELSQELASQLTEVVKQSEVKKTGWERVEEGDAYYYIETEGDVDSQEDYDDTTDNNLYEGANYFSDEKLAEKVAFRQTLERKLMRFSAENDGDKIDWDNDNNSKYGLYYIYYDEAICTSSFYSSLVFGAIPFCTREIAQLAIDTFKDDLIKYFTTMRL